MNVKAVTECQISTISELIDWQAKTRAEQVSLASPETCKLLTCSFLSRNHCSAQIRRTAISRKAQARL